MSDMTTRNAGTKALVTGGAQGIGLAVATQLAAEGCKALALVGRSEEKGAAAVATLEKLGAEAIFLEVAEDNTAAIALYRSARFSWAGRRSGYYRRDDEATDALVMRRWLNRIG